MRRIAILAMAMLMVVATAAVASANHVRPVVTEITKPADGGWSCEGGIKIEPVESGTYGGITITVHDDKTFDFSTSGVLVTSVIVKGGPNANLYSYGSPTRGDTGLHAPENDKNGKYYGLSHLCFMTRTKKGGTSS